MNDFPSLEKYISPRPKNVSSELLDESISIEKRIKIGISLLSDKNQRLFICDCAEHSLFQSDQRLDAQDYKTIKLIRRCASRQTIDKKVVIPRKTKIALNINALDWTDSKSSAEFASNVAAWRAFWYSPAPREDFASSTNAWKAEKEWQLSKIIEYLEKAD